MGSIRRINGKVTKEYQAWKAMKARCYAPSFKDSNYQKIGIIVCPEWRNDFNQFLKDMGNCPTGYTLDRVDNNGNYQLNNCRWASFKTQSSNRGNFNKLFTYQNDTKILKDWALTLNIKYLTLYNRIYRSGLSFERAIVSDPYSKLIKYKNKEQSMKDWCIELNLPLQTMIDRKFQGWSIEDIFETPIKKVKI